MQRFTRTALFPTTILLSLTLAAFGQSPTRDDVSRACAGPLYPGQIFETPLQAISMSVADLNGDIFPDLVVSSGAESTISVHLNQGGQVLSAPTSYPVGAGPREIGLGDLDGDGDLDVVVACSDAQRLDIFANDGDGNLSQQASWPIAGSCRAIVLADMNGDTRLDILVGNDQVGGNELAILFGAEFGNFLNPVYYNTCGLVWSLAVADIDKDGDLDVAVANVGCDNLTVLQNTGDGSLGASVNYGAVLSPRDVLLQDVNGDDRPDLIAVSNGWTTGLHVRLNQGDGTFGPRDTYELVAIEPWALAAGDFDNDADVDMVVGSRQGDAITLCRNMGNGTFVLDNPLPTEERLFDLSAADYDLDGMLDIAVLGNVRGAITVHWNLSDLGLWARMDRVSTQTIWRPFCADVNGDGLIDVGGEAAGDAWFWLASSMGIAEAPSIYTVDGANQILLCDQFDQNAYADFIGKTANGCILVARNGPLGTDTFGPICPSSGSFGSVRAIDRDGDGDLDLLAQTSDNDLIVMTNNGAGEFEVVQLWESSAQFEFGVGFVDTDLWADIVVFERRYDGSPNTVLLFLASEDGQDLQLVGTSSVAALANMSGFHIVDATGDGLGDVVAGGAATYIWPALPSGALSPRQEIPGNFVACRDLDLDGWPDLTTIGSSANIRLYFGLGSSQFVLGGEYRAPWWPRSFATADLEGDGDFDIVLTSGNPARRLSILSSEPRCLPLEECLGDINGDGAITFADLNRVLASFNLVAGNPGFDQDADLDSDGEVGFSDLNFLLGVYNMSCTSL